MSRSTRYGFGVLALLGALAAPGAASAAGEAIATADLTMRGGPSTRERSIGGIARGRTVRVLGCLADRAWCEVAVDGRRGWAASRYLAPVAVADAPAAPAVPARPRGDGGWNDPALYDFDIVIAPDIRARPHPHAQQRDRRHEPRFPIDPKIGAYRAGDHAPYPHHERLDRIRNSDRPRSDIVDFDDDASVTERRRDALREAREARRDRIRDARDARREAIREGR